MILVNTRDVRTFQDYLKSLSKSARKNYRYVEKHNKDLEYKRVPFNKEKTAWFMDLWERQIIRGHTRKWAFGVEYPEKLEATGKLRCFVAVKDEEELSMQFVENHNGYVECHPPMYDKTKHSKRYLAKFMWFNLIRYAIESPEMEMGNWIDFGGCGDDPWPEVIKNRHNYPHNHYKWQYVPQKVKENPDDQPRLVVRRPAGMLGEIKYLEEV